MARTKKEPKPKKFDICARFLCGMYAYHHVGLTGECMIKGVDYEYFVKRDGKEANLVESPS